MNPTIQQTLPPIETPGSEDYEAILDVWESSVRATHDFLHEDDLQLFRSLIPRLLEMVDLYCVRDEAGAISGFLGTAGEGIEMLFIRADQRGKGVGKRLLHHAIHTLGFRKVDVNEQNVQATGFYLRSGFRVTGRSERDGMGLPYPLLHLEYRENS